MTFDNARCTSRAVGLVEVGNMNKRYLTHREVCEILGVHYRTLYRWRKSGYFPKPGYIGRQPVYSPEVVDDWIARQASQ